MNDFDPLRETPRLPVVPFVAADVVLVGVAALIGWQAEAPLGVAPLAAISLLVGLGAIVGLYPFFQNHARRQEASLQERADQIEALARTLGATAEQVSIAVANLPAIAENSARQLKLAEQLPAAIHGQIAALQHQLSATAAEENAALRHELDTLRGAETDKLVTALADLGRLEALVARHATTLDVAISHLPRLADNVGERTAEAIRRETEVSLRSLRAAVAEASVALASATNETRAAFESSARDAVAHLSTRANSLPPFQVIVPEPPAPVVVVEPPAPAVSAVEPAAEEAVQAEPLATAPEGKQDAAPEPVASGLMDDSGLDEPASPAVAPEPAVESAARPEQETAPVVEPEPVAIAPEPAPAPVAEPVVDDEPTPEPAAPVAESATEPDPAPAAESESDTDSDPADSDTDAEPEAEAVVASDEDASSTEEPVATAALSHDGYTRLLVTAYIGIGNKLFIRGDGPGLRSDKGVALQFVSIGKWRWESAELLFPAKVRLYKNDQVECAALGELTLEPGHHHEVAAQF